MSHIVTADLSKFGYRELAMAGELLLAYGDNGADFLGDGITLNMNANSGMVFLSDEDMKVGVMEGGKIVEFFSCPECGNEGTLEDGEDYEFDVYQGYCSQVCKDKNQ